MLAHAKQELCPVLANVEAYGLFLDLRNATNSRNELIVSAVSPVMWLDRDIDSARDGLLVGIAGGFDGAVFPMLHDSAVVASALRAILNRGQLGQDETVPDVRAIVDVRDGGNLVNTEYDDEEDKEEEIS